MTASAMPQIRTVETIFRSLIVAQIICCFLSLFLVILDSILTDQAVTDRIGEVEFSFTWLVFSVVVFGFGFVFLLPALVASLVGLLFWKWWARSLYLVSWLVGTTMFIAYSLFDFQWDLRWTLPDRIEILSEALTGATLALAYFSPIAERFSPVSKEPQNAN